MATLEAITAKAVNEHKEFQYLKLRCLHYFGRLPCEKNWGALIDYTLDRYNQRRSYGHSQFEAKYMALLDYEDVLKKAKNP